MSCNQPNQARNSIQINGRAIGKQYPPYIIAELSANHQGALDTAIKSLHAAKHAGADAIKLQTYTADTITLDCDSDDFIIKEGLWAGRRLYELYDEAHTPWEWHPTLFATAAELGITLFSSPFDTRAVDLLEDLNTPAYKIASFEAIDLPLIRYVAQTGKPMIISTGMADKDEISEAVDTARSHGCHELALLHCVSGYPAPAEDYHLQTLKDIEASFNTVVGLSDHTLGVATAVGSVALGAAIIEKHFILDRQAGGPDASFSLEPDELARLCQETNTAWQALGRINYARKSSEHENLTFRRSLYFVKDIEQGQTITPDHIRSIRPGFGLAPKYYDQVIGKTVARNITRGTAVTHEVLVDTDIRVQPYD